jgi:cell division septation protein DedD
MAKFGFRKGASEDEGNPGDREMEVTPPEGISESPEGGDEGDGRSRRIFIIAGLGLVLIGGLYLANQLFLTPPSPPPTPIRPAIPAPQTKAPAPASPTKEVAPAPVAPAMPAAKAEARPATNAPAAGVAPTGPSKPEGEKAAQSEKAPVPPKTEVPSAAKPAPAPSAGYSLQVAAMVMEANAESLKRKLDAVGFQSVIRKGTAFVTKHVVTVGDPTGKSEAEDLARRLTVDGFPSQLVTVGGQFTPQIGAFFNLDEAIDLARELQKRNYPPKITSKPANTVVFQIRHGKFDSRTAAVKRGEELKAKGFNFLVVRE